MHSVLNTVETDGVALHEIGNPVLIDNALTTESVKHANLAITGLAPAAVPLGMALTIIALLHELNESAGMDEPMATIVPHATSEKNAT